MQDSSQNSLHIGAVVDTAALNQGFDESRASTQAFVDGLSVAFQGGRAASLRAFNGISDDVKQMAASVTEEQQAVSAAMRETSAATADLRRTTTLLKDGSSDAALAQKLHAAAIERVAEAEAKLSAAQDIATAKQREEAEAAKLAAQAEEQRQRIAAANAVVSGSGGSAGEAQHRLASATLENAAAQRTLREVMNGVANSTLSEAEKTQALAVAQERARITSLELMEAQEALGVAEEVTGTQATSAFVRAGESGKIGVRATENFIAKTLGLGGAMKMLFPIIGAAGLLGIVYDFGMEGAKAFDLTHERARATEDAVRSLNNELRDSNTSLDVQIDKLQQEQAKLEKKPFNGIKLALDEAAESAQKLQKQLDGVIEREMKALQGMSASVPQRILAGGSQTGYEQTMLREHNKWLGQTVTTQDQLNESVSYGNSLQTRLTELREKQKQADEVNRNGGSGVTRYEEEIKGVQQLIAWQQQEHATIQKTIDLQKQTSSTQQARDKHEDDHLSGEAERKSEEAARKAEAARRKADQDRLRALEVAVLTEKTLFSSSADNERAFWQAKLGLFTAGSTQYLEVLRKIEEADKKAEEEAKKRAAAQKKDAEEATKALDHAMDGMRKWSQQIAEDTSRSGERWSDYWKTVAQGQEQAAAMTESMSLEQVHALLATGGITALGAAHQEAAIHAEEHRRKIQALEEELARLQALAAKKPVDPLTGQQLIDPKLAGQIAQTQNALNQQKGSAKLSGAQDQQAISQQIAKPWLTAFDSIESGWMSAQRSMLTGQKSAAAAMKGVAANLAMSMIEGTEKAALDFVKKELLKTATHAAQKQLQLTTDAGSAAAGTAIAKTENAAQGLDAAKLAFKNVYAQVSSWPFVGPVMAPILAAGAFTAVAAFEQGTMHVPREGMAVLHPGEAVLGSPSAAVMRDALSGRLNGAGGGDLNVNFNGNHTFNGGDAHSSGLVSHERQLVKTLKRLHRDGHLNFARSN